MAINAYSRLDNLGTQDNSKRTIPPVATPTPQFLPKIFFMNDRGPIEPQLCTGETLVALFGDDVINEDSNFHKHSNILFPAVHGNGGSSMGHRLVDPAVINSRSNVVLYLDILEDDLDEYKRHSDGSYVYDDNGDPVKDDDNSPYKGYRVKWIAEIEDGNTETGTQTLKDGTMTDSDDNKSTMYPIYEFRATAPGSFYNNIGFALDAFDTTDINKSQLEDYKTFPFKLSVYKKANSVSTPRIVRSITDAPAIKFAMRPNAKDPVSKTKLGLKFAQKEFYNAWEFPEFAAPYVYEANLATVLDKLYVKEAAWRNTVINTNEGDVNTDTWYDFLPDVEPNDEKWMLNPVTFRTLSRVPYFGFQHDTGDADLADNQADITLSKNLPVFMNGGLDGDTSDAMFEQLVRDEMEKYLDKDGPYYDPAVNLESAMVDTGYSFETKKSLVNFITLRKDTFLFLGTYTVNANNKPLTVEEERAIGIALNNRCQLAIESSYFNTPVARAIIVGGSGEYRNSVNMDRYSLVIDLVEKVTKMMGRPKWDKTAIFDRAETDVITSMVNIEPKVIPESVKEALWGINIVYPQAQDRETYAFPALQTVYPYDNSILNNIFTALAIVNIHKVAYQAQSRFSGNTSLPDAEFLSKVDAFMNDKFEGAYADMFDVTASSTLTDYDKATGFSWTTNVDIYGTVMKTVMNFSVGAYRK